MPDCQSMYETLRQYFAKAHKKEKPDAVATMTVQHSNSGEVQYLTAQVQFDASAQQFRFSGPVLDSGSKFVAKSSYEWSVTIANTGQVQWTSKFGSYEFLADCSLHPGFWLGYNVKAVSGPPQEHACAMLSVEMKPWKEE